MHPDPISGKLCAPIIEDETLIAEELRERLSRLGITVIAAVSSGEEGVEIATSEQPDLVLMDRRLSGKKYGIQAATEIREHVNIPIVYLTAHSDHRTVERAHKTDHDGFILKPFQKGIAVDHRGSVEALCHQGKRKPGVMVPQCLPEDKRQQSSLAPRRVVKKT